MDWLAFLIGVFVGWIIEWLIDFFYWRRRNAPGQQEKETIQRGLDQAQQRIRSLEATEKELDQARHQIRVLEGRERELEQARQRIDELEARERDLEQGRPAHFGLGHGRAEEAAVPVQPSDLVKIEGIGPKIAQVLNDAGILTFAQLAATGCDHLRTILREAGPNYQLADPTTWPEQARLAAAGAWDDFQTLQERLSAGRQAPHRPQ